MPLRVEGRPRRMRGPHPAQTSAEGLDYVYLGNVYDTQWGDTYCNGCNTKLVSRYGLNARNLGLDGAGRCTKCGRDAHFKLIPPGAPRVMRT